MFHLSSSHFPESTLSKENREISRKWNEPLQRLIMIDDKWKVSDPKSFETKDLRLPAQIYRPRPTNRVNALKFHEAQSARETEHSPSYSTSFSRARYAAIPWIAWAKSISSFPVFSAASFLFVLCIMLVGPAGNVQATSEDLINPIVSWISRSRSLPLSLTTWWFLWSKLSSKYPPFSRD